MTNLNEMEFFIARLYQRWANTWHALMLRCIWLCIFFCHIY